VAGNIVTGRFARRDFESMALMETALDRKNLHTAVALFGAGDVDVKLAHAPNILLPTGDSKALALMAALVAFSRHHTGPLPGVVLEESGAYGFSDDPEEFKFATILPRAVLSRALDLPQNLLGALNEACKKGKSRDGLRHTLVALAGEQSCDSGTTYPGLPISEDVARAFLSIADGTGDGLEEAAAVCDVDPRLVEGLVLLSAARPCDDMLVDTQKLVANPGIETLFQWTGIPRVQGAALLGASKLDPDNSAFCSKALGLSSDIEPMVLKAMQTCCEVSCASYAEVYEGGFKALADCMGAMGTMFGVKDRRTAETCAIIMRLCQGDASPLKRCSNRLGVGLRVVPFLGAVSLLANAQPMDSNPGATDAWMEVRHGATATRRLAYVLRLDELKCYALVEAGRGLDRGCVSFSAYHV